MYIDEVTQRHDIDCGLTLKALTEKLVHDFSEFTKMSGSGDPINTAQAVGISIEGDGVWRGSSMT